MTANRIEGTKLARVRSGEVEIKVRCQSVPVYQKSAQTLYVGVHQIACRLQIATCVTRAPRKENDETIL